MVIVNVSTNPYVPSDIDCAHTECVTDEHSLRHRCEKTICIDLFQQATDEGEICAVNECRARERERADETNIQQLFVANRVASSDTDLSRRSPCHKSAEHATGSFPGKKIIHRKNRDIVRARTRTEACQR